LAIFVKQMTPDVLEAENKARERRGDDLLPVLTAEEVDAYMRTAHLPGSTGPNNKKVMTGDRIRTMAQMFPIRSMQIVAEAIVEDNAEKLDKYKAFQYGYNAFHAMVNEGDGPQLEELMIALAKRTPGNNRDLLFKALRETLAKEEQHVQVTLDK